MIWISLFMFLHHRQTRLLLILPTSALSRLLFWVAPRNRLWNRGWTLLKQRKKNVSFSYRSFSFEIRRHPTPLKTPLQIRCDFIAGMFNNCDYDKLDMPEFLAGFLAMIKPYDTALRSAMLLHLEILATKAISAIRGIACAVSMLTWLNKLN